MTSPEDEDDLSAVEKLLLKMARRGFPVDFRDPPPEEGAPSDQASKPPAEAKKDETS